jgi:hypothetical protein
MSRHETIPFHKGFNKKRKGVDTQLPRNRKVTRSTVQ